MTIRPHNRIHPVPLNSHCHLCDGQWKLVRLTADEKSYLNLERNEVVVKCRSCGVCSVAIREVVASHDVVQ
jgi:formate dehydrogenase maturation protein FdhE